MHRHLAKVSAAVVVVIVTALLIILTGFTADLVWLIAPIAGLAWVTHQTTTAAIQSKAPGQQTLSTGSMESVILIGSLLAIVVGYFIIRSRQDSPSPAGNVPGTGLVTAPPAPPQVPEDVEVRDFLKFHLAEGSQLLPVVTNPLVQPETVFSAVAYNPVRDKAKLTAIDLSLYEGASLNVRLLQRGQVPINFRTGVGAYEENRLGFYPGTSRFSLESTAGSTTLVPGPEDDPVDKEMLVEFRVKPLANHSLWFKTERLTDGTPNQDPFGASLPLGCVYWGRIPLVCNGKSLQRVVVQAEIPHPEKAGLLLMESDLQLMKPLAVRLRGSSGQIDQDRTVSFDTVSQLRVATDEALLTNEYYDIYIFTDTNVPLLWRISVRCDWPAGT